MLPDINFWKDKKVFLTGHTGFKGSWLTIWLKEMGAEVAGFSLEPTLSPNLFQELEIGDEIHHIIGDVQDLSLLSKKINHFKPEVIFHMAAQPLVRYSYKHPIETFRTNILGTVNLFESAKICSSVKCIINITTDKCYENLELNKAFKEEDPLGGHDPYSSSKACSELITSAYRSSFFLDLGLGIASARAGNVIGGGDWSEDRLIPDVVEAFKNKREVILRNPNSTRPWQHVLDPLAGYLILAEELYKNESYSGGWNFGPNNNESKTVEWVVDRCSSVWGNKESQISIDNSEGLKEANYLRLDISKAKKILEWEPNWNIDVSIERSINWYKAWEQRVPARSLCLEDINNFCLDYENK